MSTDSYHFTPQKRARMYNKETDDLEPVKIKCANCYNYVRFVWQNTQVFKLREGDPRIAQMGKDKVYRTENWCTNCMRSANIEDDSSRTFVNLGGMG